MAPTLDFSPRKISGRERIGARIGYRSCSHLRREGRGTTPGNKVILVTVLPPVWWDAGSVACNVDCVGHRSCPQAFDGPANAGRTVCRLLGSHDATLITQRTETSVVRRARIGQARRRPVLRLSTPRRGHGVGSRFGLSYGANADLNSVQLESVPGRLERQVRGQWSSA